MSWGILHDAINRMQRLRPDLGSRRSGIRPHELGHGGAREEFPCMHLCSACGYLGDNRAPCPACAATMWIDLGLTAHAHALRDREWAERQLPARDVHWQIRLASLGIGGGLGTAAAAGLAAAGVLAFWPALLACGAGASLATFGLGQRRLGWSIMARRVRAPRRWRLPLPVADGRAPIVRRASGRAEPREALLRAPFSGRPCVAYEIGVLFDTPNDAWPPIWVLSEMRASAFDVAGHTLPADGAALALSLDPVSTMDEAALSRFLRERGLFATDGQFDLFEAVVEPGATVDLQWPGAPAGAPPFVRVTGGPAPGGPYR